MSQNIQHWLKWSRLPGLPERYYLDRSTQWKETLKRQLLCGSVSNYIDWKIRNHEDPK